MKKVFLVASLSVWTLGLLVGIGFSVVGQVTGVQQLPGENYQLRAERDSLKNTIDSERNQHANIVQGYLVAINRWEFQSNKMVESLRLDATIETPAGPWPHEESLTPTPLLIYRSVKPLVYLLASNAWPSARGRSAKQP